MEDSTPSLLVADLNRPPHHLHLPTAGSDSYLSPSSALIHATSESSHRSHIHWDSDDYHDTEKPRQYRSSLIQALRERFPDGPPTVYDEFIRVSLNEIPPEASLHENEGYERPPTTTRLSRMTSQLWSVLAGSIASRPSLPLHIPRPVISHPKPIESTPLKRRRSALSPSPVQNYTNSFINGGGIGPPAPLPSPSDIIDIRPQSRNATNSTNSRSRSSSRHRKQPPSAEITIPPPVVSTHPELSTKNSITFPSYAAGRKKIVRIVTPGTMQPPIPTTGPSIEIPAVSSSQSRFTNTQFSFGTLMAYVLRILHFYDPAESLFVLGFLTGPQTWLLGGFYLPSVDRREKKSQLRIWVDKQVTETSDSPPRRKGGRTTDDLLDRLEQISAGLTSSSFEIGRRTATNSNASRIDGLTRTHGAIPAPPAPANPPSTSGHGHLDVDLDYLERGSPMMMFPHHVRASRAVWDGSKNGHQEGVYGDDEISVHLLPGRWVHRCRVAAIISGTIVMALFIAALTVVCLH